MLLNYLHTYPNAAIRYHASDMHLHIDSDAAYLVEPNAKSRIAGFYYCSTKPPITKVPLNGPILVECRLLQHVVTSAAEAETAALFYNCQTAVHLRQMLSALGHTQQTTHVKTDNSTAESFVNDTFKQKRSKAWDVRYHWLSEQRTLGKFLVFWAKGLENLADYHTKHHPPSHHKSMRNAYILKGHHIRTKHELKTSHQNDRTELRARVCLDPTRRSLHRDIPPTPKRSNNIDSRYRPNNSAYNRLIKLLS